MGAIMRDWKNELKKMELKKQDKKENEVIEQKSIRKQFMEYFGEKNHHTNRTEEIDEIKKKDAVKKDEVKQEQKRKNQL
jgi:hypothetical protein